MAHDPSVDRAESILFDACSRALAGEDFSSLEIVEALPDPRMLTARQKALWVGLHCWNDEAPARGSHPAIAAFSQTRLRDLSERLGRS